MTDTAKPVVAGLAAGIAFIMLFAIMSDNVLTVRDDNVRILVSDKNEIVPSSFKMVYSYGVGLDYTLTVDDTLTGTFAAQNCYLIVPSRQAALALSEQEIQSIWKAINENDFFSLGDLTEQCSPLAVCTVIAPEDKTELQITAGNETNKIEFWQNYEFNHNTPELKRFKAIVSAIDEVLTHYDNLPQTDCRYL